MNIKELVKKINNYFDCDIRQLTNQKEIVAPRKVFFVLGNEMGYSLSMMGREVNRSHSMAWVAVTKHVDNLKYDSYYKTCYTTFHEYLYGAKLVKETKDIKTHIKGFNALLELNEDELLEFKETRLKPFLSMLKSRNKHKQLINK